MLTLDNVKDILIQTDEITLLEVLDISSEDIIDRFGDLVENRYEELARDLAADRKQLCSFEDGEQ
jgi:hypothetical protein|tara:strand:- start:326 stop:520 length:195 start_codon:yes stop_codon:yes gene_type:complete